MVKPKWLFAVAIFIFKRGSLSVLYLVRQCVKCLVNIATKNMTVKNRLQYHMCSFSVSFMPWKLHKHYFCVIVTGLAHNFFFTILKIKRNKKVDYCVTFANQKTIK
jgi:hypothetical protein